MAKRKKKKATKNPDIKVVARNRRARHDYQIESTMEAGIVLVGTEVKSLRNGKCDIADSYASIKEGELVLIGMNIAVYDKASHFNHEPRQDRVLLMKKREIEKLTIKIRERGYTLVPLEVYFTKKGWAKVALGLAKGLKQHDNRESIKRKEDRRDMRDAAQKIKQ